MALYKYLYYLMFYTGNALFFGRSFSDTAYTFVVFFTINTQYAIVVFNFVIFWSFVQLSLRFHCIGGARAFAAWGKRLFCRPTPSDLQYRYDYCEVVDCVNIVG